MLRTLALGILFAGLLFCQNAPPGNLLQQAIQRQKSGDVKAAVQDYREFLSAEPANIVALSNLGVLLAHTGHFDQAAAEYKKALKIDPSNASIRLNLGLAFYKSGRVPEAAKIFATARTLAPDNMQLTLLLADCRLRMGDNAGVVALLEPIEKENADNLAIAYLLGTALIRNHQIAEGQKFVDRILRHGDSAAAHMLLGGQMFADGDYPGAIKELQVAIQKDPKLPGAESLYGQALLYTDDPDAAAQAFRKELAADPNNYESNLRLAQILIERRKWKLAEPLVDRALRVRPQAVPPMLALADVEIGEARFAEAEVELTRAGKLAPQSAGFHERLARVYAALHREPEAARERRLAAQLSAKMGSRERGPVPGDIAPAFTAAEPGSEQRVSLDKLRHHGPVLLVFGSYTCPNFRAASGTLNRLYAKFKGQIPFYLIYIREAHTGGGWQSTRNERAGISLPPATDMTERAAHAALCVRKLHLQFPALLDNNQGSAAKAYAAWPSSAYVIGGDGRIVFRTGLTEQEFKPSQLQAAVRKASAKMQ
ncbi:MAG TPA: tetratricopeptide repeat protein [Bryobacteraceae bacterium]